jgi:hypothetical protein
MKDFFADYGGVPNSSAPGDISTNDSAIASALSDAVSGTCDGFYFDKMFYFSEPFSYPVESASPYRPLHFGIQGISPMAWMMYTGDPSDPAISISGTPFPSEYPNNELVLWLNDFVLNGGGIYIYDCGKYLRTRNMTVVGCAGPDYAVHVDSNDGGSLQFNVHECSIPGIRLENCTNVDVDLTARVCTGQGIDLFNCSDLSGRLYAESNTYFNITAGVLSRSTLSVWMEGAYFEQTAPYTMTQGARNLCWGNTFYGQMQVTSGSAWYDDPLSAVANTDISSPQLALPNVGSLVTTSGMQLGTPVNWSTGQLEVSMDSLSVTVHSGAFDSTPVGTPRYVEFIESSGGTDLSSLSYSAGDILIFKFKVTSSQSDYLTTDNHPAIYMTINYTDFGQNFWITGPGTIEFVSEPIIFSTSGTGVSIVGYYDAANSDGSPLTGPTEDYTLTFSDIEVRFLADI